MRKKGNIIYNDSIVDELHLYVDWKVKINLLIDDMNLEIYENTITEDLVKKELWIQILDVDDDTKRFILSELHNSNYKLSPETKLKIA
jgi:hypothetical protein